VGKIGGNEVNIDLYSILETDAQTVGENGQNEVKHTLRCSILESTHCLWREWAELRSTWSRCSVLENDALSVGEMGEN